MNKQDFYQSHLDKVSRSFAFCIKQLRSPYRMWVSLTYLVCRILDTVEDAPWSHKQIQLNVFKEFEKSLFEPKQIGNIKEKLKYFPHQTPDHELDLLKDSDLLFSDLHKFPAEAKNTIQDTVRSMCLGMQHFVTKKKDGVLKIQTLTELNQYCFFVAGVVGEALSKLILRNHSNGNLHRKTLIQSFHFGLFLQKINILKDQDSDEKEGRFFVPNRQEVYKSLIKNSDNAFDYIASIPSELKDYKLFCLWSFFLGMASLPFLHRSYVSKKTIKISKIETWQVLDHVKSIVDDNEKLEALYKTYRPVLINLSEEKDPLPKASENGKALSNQEFLKCYVGQLSPSELEEIGVNNLA